MILLDACQNNILLAGITVIYVKVVIFLCDNGVKERILDPDVSRKIIHIAAACWILWWPYFDASHWTWRLNVLVPAVFSVQLVIKGLIIRDKNDPDVRTMSRSGEPLELCFGPLQFTLVMCVLGLVYFRDERSVYVISALGFGDGIAPVIGKRYGSKTRFYNGKSLHGCFAFFVATVIGQLLLSSWLGYPEFVLNRTLEAACIGTIVELVSPKMSDNIFVPLSIFALRSI